TAIGARHAWEATDMKLVRYGRAGFERPGAIDADGKLRDLGRVIKDVTPAALAPAMLKKLRSVNLARLPVVRGRPRLGCPLAGMGKMICIGLNSTDHTRPDTLEPMGPWHVTADAAADPQAMALWTTVSGERRQHGNTGEMIFSVASLLAYVRRFMSLRAGDVISTGTPAGGGHGAKPPRYLQPGDVVEMGISGLGTQRHKIVESK